VPARSDGEKQDDEASFARSRKVLGSKRQRDKDSDLLAAIDLAEKGGRT